MDWVEMPVNRASIIKVSVTQQIEAMPAYFSRLLDDSCYLIGKPLPQQDQDGIDRIRSEKEVPDLTGEGIPDIPGEIESQDGERRVLPLSEFLTHAALQLCAVHLHQSEADLSPAVEAHVVMWPNRECKQNIAIWSPQNPLRLACVTFRILLYLPGAPRRVLNVCVRYGSGLGEAVQQMWNEVRLLHETEAA
jgi:hypothetical protein